MILYLIDVIQRILKYCKCRYQSYNISTIHSSTSFLIENMLDILFEYFELEWNIWFELLFMKPNKLKIFITHVFSRILMYKTSSSLRRLVCLPSSSRKLFTIVIHWRILIDTNSRWSFDKYKFIQIVLNESKWMLKLNLKALVFDSVTQSWRFIILRTPSSLSS